MLIIALLIGFALGWLGCLAYKNKHIALLTSQIALPSNLKDSVQQDVKSVITDSQQSLTQLIKPLTDTLQRYESKYTDFERHRSQVYGALQSELKAVADSGQSIKQETAKLIQALKSSPKTKGRWGELSLQNVLQLSGLTEGVDYKVQPSFIRDDDTLRPDVIIHLPNNRYLVVDAKASMTAYLDAIEEPNEWLKDAHLDKHASNIRAQLKLLADKSYWDSLVVTPDFVIMFIPGDNFYSAACERDSSLFEDAINQHVIIVTPTTLIALAKAVAFGWRQEKLARNVKEVHELGVDLYRRLKGMVQYITDCGDSLTKAVSGYNSFIGSLERSVYPQLRRFEQLGVTDTVAEPLEALDAKTRLVKADLR